MRPLADFRKTLDFGFVICMMVSIRSNGTTDSQRNTMIFQAPKHKTAGAKGRPQRLQAVRCFSPPRGGFRDMPAVPSFFSLQALWLFGRGRGTVGDAVFNTCLWKSLGIAYPLGLLHH